jgi:hypothetical protein
MQVDAEAAQAIAVRCEKVLEPGNQIRAFVAIGTGRGRDQADPDRATVAR